MSRRTTPAALLVLVLATLSGCTADGADDAGLKGVGGAEFDEAAFVAGLVVDPEIVPVEGADVFVEGLDLWATTDAAGAFRVGPLEPGTYTLRAERYGYAADSQDVRVGGGPVEDLLLVVNPLASDVPYHEILIFQGYVMCHFVTATPIGGVNVPCAAAIDLVVPNTAPDKWVFPFRVENPGFQSMALEMTWVTQQLGKDGLMQLSTIGNAEASGSGVTVGGTVYGDTMGDPFHAIIHAGNSYWETADGPVVFYPEPDETVDFKLMVAGGGGNTSVPDTAVFVEFRPTAYVTNFYNRPARADYSALPDE